MDFVLELLQQLRMQVCIASGQVIVAGEIGEEIYFIAHGPYAYTRTRTPTRTHTYTHRYTAPCVHRCPVSYRRAPLQRSPRPNPPAPRAAGTARLSAANCNCVLDICTPGKYFGELELFTTPCKRIFGVRCLENSELYKIDRQARTRRPRVALVLRLRCR